MTMLPSLFTLVTRVRKISLGAGGVRKFSAVLRVAACETYFAAAENHSRDRVRHPSLRYTEGLRQAERRE